MLGQRRAAGGTSYGGPVRSRHTRRITTVLGLVPLTTLITIAIALVWLRGGTPAILDETGRRSRRAIAKLEWLELGGVRQAVLLRGADTTKPVVLFLHGGPGMPAMYLAHAFQRPLEHDFVMVQWDRRGAGKSYAARLPAESLTVRRTLADLYDLTELLRVRFHQDRIYLVAHSWGTYLGLVALTEHPEWYRGDVGMGQVAADTVSARAMQRRLVLDEARRRGKAALAPRLVGPAGRVTEDDLFAVGGELRNATSLWPLLRTGLFAPEYTLFDALNVRKGAQLLSRTFARAPGPPLPVAGTSLSVPAYLFLGRYDYVTPSAVASAYFDSLIPPLKGVVWFEQSAQFPFFEEPERFHLELRRFDSMVSRHWTSKPDS
ncbi:MAG: alpha/beta fold hydrolase [Gemmatimonadales bacterium]